MLLLKNGAAVLAPHRVCAPRRRRTGWLRQCSVGRRRACVHSGHCGCDESPPAGDRSPTDRRRRRWSRGAGSAWLQVDFEGHLRDFYIDALRFYLDRCGSHRPVAAYGRVTSAVRPICCRPAPAWLTDGRLTSGDASNHGVDRSPADHSFGDGGRSTSRPSATVGSRLAIAATSDRSASRTCRLGSRPGKTRKDVAVRCRTNARDQGGQVQMQSE